VIIDLGVAEMFSVADPAGRFIGGTPTTMAPEARFPTFFTDLKGKNTSGKFITTKWFGSWFSWN